MDPASPVDSDAGGAALSVAASRSVVVDGLRPWALVAALAAGVTLALAMGPQPLDDAQITFAYARSLAQGHGPVAYPGGPVAEGFSSPLWCGALALVGLVDPAAIPAAARALGLLAVALAVLAGAYAAAREEGPVVPSIAAAWAIATLPALQYYGGTGLEAPAFVAVVLAVLAAARGTIALRWGAVAAALATPLRPEGPWLVVMLLALVVAWTWIDRPPRDEGGIRSPGWLPSRGDPRRRALLLALAVVAGSALVLAWRLAQFGDVVPNTFHSKRPVSGEGLRYLAALLGTTSGRGIVALAGLALLTTIAPPWRVRGDDSAGRAPGQGPERAAALAGLVWLGAPLLEGGDWMPQWRLAAPATACGVVAAAGLAQRGRARGRFARSLGVVALAGLVAVMALDGMARAELHRRLLQVQAENDAIAAALVEAGADSVAAVDVGALLWRHRLAVVDLTGLTDPGIARAPGAHFDKRFDVAAVLGQRRPDAVVIRLWSPPAADAGGRGWRAQPAALEAMSPIERSVLEHPYVRAHYEPVALFEPGFAREAYYGRLVLWRRSQPLPRFVGARVQWPYRAGGSLVDAVPRAGAGPRGP